MKSEEEKLFGYDAFLPAKDYSDSEELPALYDGDEKNDEEELKDDLQMARETYRGLLEKSDNAMDSIMRVIGESESPRAVEVLSGLIKSIGDTADKLVDMHGKKNDIGSKKKRGSDDGTVGTNVQNNIYVGSTDELQALFHSKKKQGEKVVDEDESDK